MTDYRKHPALNFSLAKALLDSPAHFQAAKSSTREVSRDMIMGTMVHAVALEDKCIPAICAVKPEGMSFVTKEGKSWRDAQTLEIITVDEYEKICGMAESIRNNDTARTMLANSPHREVPITGNMFGVECKGLLDAYGQRGSEGAILDLKTCQHATPRRFAYHVADFHYDLQLAWYSTLAAMNYGLESPPFFAWIAVEKTPPYTCVVYDGSEHYEQGMEKLGRVLELYKKCVKDGEWPQPYQGLQSLTPARKHE